MYQVTCNAPLQRLPPRKEKLRHHLSPIVAYTVTCTSFTARMSLSSLFPRPHPFCRHPHHPGTPHAHSLCITNQSNENYIFTYIPLDDPSVTPSCRLIAKADRTASQSTLTGRECRESERETEREKTESNGRGGGTVLCIPRTRGGGV